MTLDGFLSFLALFIAFYTIVSPVTRLRAQLHLAVQIPLALLAVSLVFYFEFFSLVSQPCLLASTEACTWLTFPKDGSFTPPQAAFLVVFVWMILAWRLNVLLKPGPRSMVAVGKIMQTLLYERRFAELLDFIRPHLGLIQAVAERQLLRQRAHDWLADTNWLRRQQIRTFKPAECDGDEPKQPRAGYGKRISEAFRRRIRWARHFVPASSRAQASAETLVRMLLRSEEFRKFLVTMRPDALPDFMAIKLQPRFDFSDKALRDLITDSGSRLYQEIEQNQNLADKGGYAIPGENVLLRFLFGDAQVAHNLGAWKPIGDAVIDTIRAGAPSGYVAHLNGRANDFDDEQWHDITFVGIRYFDIMVNEAMRQGVPYHMWLFYLPLFVTELEGIYDTTGHNIDTMAEFPTRNARLLYEAFDVMGNWVRNIRHLDSTSRHAVIPAMNEFSTGAIPVDAAVALGNAMAVVALSDRIGDTFAGYLHDGILHDIASLSHEGLEGRMRALLIRMIVAGGNRHPAARYGQRLKTFLVMADHVLRGSVKDYVAAVEAAFPESRRGG
ncbi:hypothetical protein FJV83_28785 [Mesorhizobium sp. WSM4307]|uniref:hypothetical protein n=1 Tax=unclassified Mesorhizobium TaxID=325217 RepID=UPI000BAF360C|nr:MULTISPECIES: hypothetical protein [unclassified Mesorhizobium]PBC19309.1 hypothetical protein CK226_29710 [Mesorhizobium sp. WSM4311]TRC77690.1 hypothetical protein FJV80_25375 [Mesorhizobium sp. WSM4310]TRC78083.1 hypothetical protein FJV81_11030 [Mesorhizobium sp. WSM4315]TRC79272.1 hypothetical protein FJV83_28785 [Mesorhizobium sp. WSM4307]TRD00254.1 hypothetical protein FJV82_21775 [Mesorhizobium sp. WSM4305]